MDWSEKGWEEFLSNRIALMEAVQRRKEQVASGQEPDMTDVLGGSSAAATSKAAKPSSRPMPTVGSDEEYNRLPSGTWFLTPAGHQLLKP